MPSDVTEFHDAVAPPVLDLIARATAEVADEYFQLPIAGEDPCYRERVYCYELYHRLRVRWPEDLRAFTLSGEVDKSGHPVIRGPLLHASKPDFLVHVPGGMNENALVMEVKPIRADVEQFERDVRKVAAYLRHPAQYAMGICLIYGRDSHGSFNKLREAGRAIVSGDEVLARFHLLRHEAPGSAARAVPWI
jgi:hypothetical protein